MVRVALTWPMVADAFGVRSCLISPEGSRTRVYVGLLLSEELSGGAGGPDDLTAPLPHLQLDGIVHHCPRGDGLHRQESCRAA